MEPVELTVLNDNGFEEAGKVTVSAEPGKAMAQDLVAKRREPEVANGFVSGQVVDEAGIAVPKARVELGNEAVLSKDAVDAGSFGQKGKKPTWTGGTFWPARLVANAQGEFKFDMLHDGVSDVWAEDDHGRAGWTQDVKIGATGVKVVLRPRDAMLRLDGRVVDEQGKGMKGKVTLCRTDNNQPSKLVDGMTGEDGAFKLEAKTPYPTDFQFLRVVFVSDGGRIAWRTVPKNSGTIQLQLAPEAKVSGVVTDALGSPLSRTSAIVFEQANHVRGIDLREDAAQDFCRWR